MSPTAYSEKVLIENTDHLSRVFEELIFLFLIMCNVLIISWSGICGKSLRKNELDFLTSQGNCLASVLKAKS